MTTAERTSQLGPPRHFIVFVPGWMGSQLRRKGTSEIVWLDIPGLYSNPLKIGRRIDWLLENMLFSNDRLEPAGLLNEVLFVPPFGKQEHYILCWLLLASAPFLGVIGLRCRPPIIAVQPVQH